MRNGREKKHIGTIGLVIIFLLSILVIGFPEGNSSDTEETDEYYEIINKYEEISYNFTNAKSSIAQGTFSVKIEKTSYDLVLYKNRLFNNTKGSPFEDVYCYYGHVKNDEDSRVRLTISSEYIGGFINSNSETIFIEPKRNVMEDKKGDSIICYKTSDVDLNLKLDDDTDDTSVDTNRASSSESISVSNSQTSNTTVRTMTLTTGNTQYKLIRLAVYGDEEYDDEYGVYWPSNMATTINNMEDIYMNDLNTKFY